MGEYEDLRDALQTLGELRTEASVMAAMILYGEQTTKQLAKHTGLPQPQISIGTRTLKNREIIAAEKIPNKNRGRPQYKYALKVSPREVKQQCDYRYKDCHGQLERAVAVVERTLK